ncbi:GNAT family N-acetyltransferase [Halalkalicoccus subterraneus]|uniref:GNAT family N-acetyltransferase n=1 Tax=Halalkalicoccus subterraneus TaxID=2675002 RepID=UPI000EFAD81B|nr:GNAT family N-acetyltransferase [Halalkalicoccus subterraneus]
MTLDIDRLSTDDIDDAWRLSSQVGWNQTKDDWQRLLELFPSTCFAGRLDGDLVATSTLATYGDVGWIGMVLVDEAYRRRGYGSELFERALAAGHDGALDVIGLDATDAGREVYRQYGFETTVGIDRWAGPLRRPVTDGIQGYDDDSVRVEPIETAGPIADFDRTHVGTDRRVLLEHVIGADDSAALCVNRGGRVRGYAVVRSGRRRKQVGPLVAVDDTDTSALLSGVAKRVDGPVIVDALRGERTESLLRRFGLDVRRRLHRMTEGDPRSVLDGDAVVAAAGFEWG